MPSGAEKLRVTLDGVAGDFILCDEWSGETHPVTISQGDLTLPGTDGVLISLTPA